MKNYIVVFLSLELLAGGCSTHSQCRSDLYQNCIEETGDAAITIGLLEKGKTQEAHDLVIGNLALRLSELHRLGNSVNKDQRDNGIDLAHLILKHATEHREQLLQDKWSLQMVIELQSIVTNTVDIQRASELAQYLTASSTNQLRFPTP